MNFIFILCEDSFFFCWSYRRRFPKVKGGGGGKQFASLISASSRRLAAIVENFARVSGVILFIVVNARAACSNAGLRWVDTECYIVTKRKMNWDKRKNLHRFPCGQHSRLRMQLLWQWLPLPGYVWALMVFLV